MSKHLGNRGVENSPSHRGRKPTRYNSKCRHVGQRCPQLHKGNRPTVRQKGQQCGEGAAGCVIENSSKERRPRTIIHVIAILRKGQ